MTLDDLRECFKQTYLVIRNNEEDFSASWREVYYHAKKHGLDSDHFQTITLVS